MELENLSVDAKGKGASGRNREAEITDAAGRGGLPRSSDETPVMGMGAGPRADIDGPTGNRRSLLVSVEDGSFQWVARAG